MLAGKSRHKAAILGGALIGVLTPLAAQASLTISLQLAPGAAGATQSVKYLTPVNTGNDVPIYVYATVQGTQATGAQGFDYAYYNVNFANVNASIAAALDTATSKFTVDSAVGATYNVDGLGQNELPIVDAYPGNGVGSASNTASGILAGSTTTLTDIAHARSNTNNPAWSNSSANTNDIYEPSSTSVSYLLETLEVKPGAFHASTVLAGGQNYTKFTPSIPAVSTIGGPEYSGANWNEDSSTTTGQGSTASIKNASSGTYQASSTFATFEDTLAGDANADGSVNITDFNILVGNFNKPGTFNWSQGDFSGDGSVNITDFNLLVGNFNKSLTGIAPTQQQTDLAPLALFAAQNGDTATFDAITGVPEPTSLGILALGGISLLRRRRTR
jgi:hypothetical protein